MKQWNDLVQKVPDLHNAYVVEESENYVLIGGVTEMLRLKSMEGLREMGLHVVSLTGDINISCGAFILCEKKG